jgi:hypothetical protein
MQIYVVSHTTTDDPHLPTIVVFASEENARKHYDDLVRLGYQSDDDSRRSPSDVQFHEDTIMDLPPQEPIAADVAEPTFADLYA